MRCDSQLVSPYAILRWFILKFFVSKYRHGMCTRLYRKA